MRFSPVSMEFIFDSLRTVNGANSSSSWARNFNSFLPISNAFANHSRTSSTWPNHLSRAFVGLHSRANFWASAICSGGIRFARQVSVLRAIRVSSFASWHTQEVNTLIASHKIKQKPTT